MSIPPERFEFTDTEGDDFALIDYLDDKTDPRVVVYTSAFPPALDRESAEALHAWLGERLAATSPVEAESKRA